jgi:hypothetical protein
VGHCGRGDGEVRESLFSVLDFAILCEVGVALITWHRSDRGRVYAGPLVPAMTVTMTSRVDRKEGAAYGGPTFLAVCIV